MSGCPRWCGAGEVVGHEVRGLYDGVAYWSCTGCGTCWHRFTPPGRVHAWVQENIPGVLEATL